MLKAQRHNANAQVILFSSSNIACVTLVNNTNPNYTASFGLIKHRRFETNCVAILFFI